MLTIAESAANSQSVSSPFRQTWVIHIVTSILEKRAKLSNHFCFSFSRILRVGKSMVAITTEQISVSNIICMDSSKLADKTNYMNDKTAKVTDEGWNSLKQLSDPMERGRKKPNCLLIQSSLGLP